MTHTSLSPSILLHKSTERSLERLIRAQPSAIALIGLRGSGKSFVVRFIAAKLLAITNVDNYPYFTSLDAKTSGITEVRELQKKLVLKVPGMARIKRAIVIEHFDCLGHEAQNALLKTLEEPPLDTVIVLTINNEDDVLQTVYSRTQKLVVKPVSFENAKKFFSNDYSLADIEYTYKISAGSVGIMSSLLSGDENHELVRSIVEAKTILSNPKYMRIARVDSLIKGTDLPLPIVLDALTRLLDAAYTQAIKNQKTAESLRTMHNRLQKTLDTITDLDAGVNPKLALTRLFLVL